ncbi:MAG: hypothetical protein KGJ62_13860 [Armatimonadetes bacterium]|nr:hypothetical protein [Armatimonadota bacterium]MDE2206370.1 hypothetical protein [Armatimonadota bacterium]
MSDHLTDHELELWLTRQGSVANLHAYAAHLEECADCLGKVRESARAPVHVQEVLRNLFVAVPDACLTDAEISQFAIGKSPDDLATAILQEHVTVCAACQRRLAAIESEPHQQVAEPEVHIAVTEPAFTKLELAFDHEDAKRVLAANAVDLAGVVAGTDRHYHRRLRVMRHGGLAWAEIPASETGTAAVSLQDSGHVSCGGLAWLQPGKSVANIASRPSANEACSLASLQTWRAYDRLSPFIDAQYASSIARAPFEWLKLNAANACDNHILQLCLQKGGSLDFVDDLRLTVGDTVLLDEPFDAYSEGTSELRQLRPYFPGASAYITHAAHAPGSPPGSWAMLGYADSSRGDSFAISSEDVPHDRNLTFEASLMVTSATYGAILHLGHPWVESGFDMQTSLVAVGLCRGRVVANHHDLGACQLLRWTHFRCECDFRSMSFDVFIDGELAAADIPLLADRRFGCRFSQLGVSGMVALPAPV